MKIYYAIGICGHLDSMDSGNLFKLVKMVENGTNADVICDIQENKFYDHKLAIQVLNKLNSTFKMGVEIQKRQNK